MAKDNQFGYFRDVQLTNNGELKVSQATSTLNLSGGDDNRYSHINKFGRNYDIDPGAVPEYVWSKGGIYIPPTHSQSHTVTSTSNQDVGSLLYNGTTTSITTLPNGDITIIDTNATFIADGVSIGDKFINDTLLDHTLVVDVVSDTEITIQPLHDNKGVNVGDSFSIITSLGTGAGILHVFGLDANLDEISEFVILNGTTPVSLINKYLRINRAHTDLTGSVGYNDGDIDIVADNDLTTTAFITANDGQTLSAFYTVPNGKTAYITSINISLHRLVTPSNSMISATFRQSKFVPQGNIKIIEDTISISSVGSSYIQKEYNPYKVFKQRTDIWLQVDYTTDGNMSVSGGFDVILKTNV